MPWEHIALTEPNINVELLMRRINQLGAEDWELVAVISTDRTVGLNAVTAFLRRSYDSLPPPPDGQEAAWLPDPTSRHERRWWTGAYWSVRVSDGKKETTDWPRP